MHRLGSEAYVCLHGKAMPMKKQLDVDTNMTCLHAWRVWLMLLLQCCWLSWRSSHRHESAAKLSSETQAIICLLTKGVTWFWSCHCATSVLTVPGSYSREIMTQNCVQVGGNTLRRRLRHFCKLSGPHNWDKAKIWLKIKQFFVSS